MPVSIVIAALPNDNGGPITDLEYRINAGAAVSLNSVSTGTYLTTAIEGDEIQWRAVNLAGAGAWSGVKSDFSVDALSAGAGAIVINALSNLGPDLTPSAGPDEIIISEAV